jgi:hypothetical protein
VISIPRCPEMTAAHRRRAVRSQRMSDLAGL